MADTDTDRLAERFDRAERAFTLVDIDGLSLRDAAAELGVSYETVRSDVKSYRAYLAKDRDGDKEQRRARFEARLEALRKRALSFYDKNKDTRPLAAIGALNTAASLLQHERAVQGLDEPKEVKAEQDTRVTVSWGE